MKQFSIVVDGLNKPINVYAGESYELQWGNDKTVIFILANTEYLICKVSEGDCSYRILGRFDRIIDAVAFAVLLINNCDESK